jgi:phospholipid/cholesterol/gamma-HCH transport system substrate-binding protein
MGAMKSITRRMPLWIAVAIALGWVIVWVYMSGGMNGFGSWYHLRLAVPDAQNLAPGADVMIAGLPVGHIDSIERAPDGAAIDIAVAERYAPLPADTRYAIRLRTLVGENYIELYPGRSRTPLATNTALPMSHAEEYVNVDQILGTLRGPGRTGVRELLQGLGYGLGGRGDELNQVLANASGFIENADPVLTAVAERHQQLARLTNELGLVTASIGQRSAAIQQLAAMAGTSARAVAARDASLEATLIRLPGTLNQIRSTTAVLTRVSPVVAPIVASLAGAIADLKPTLTLLRPAAAEGRQVLASLSAAAPPLEQTLRDARALTPAATSAIPGLHEALCQLEPMASFLSPYYREVPGVLQSLGSSGNFYDGSAHAFRLGVTVGVQSLASYYPAPMLGAIEKLLGSGLLQKVQRFGYDPNPGPGGAGETATAGGPVNARTMTKTYPHVLPAC